MTGSRPSRERDDQALEALCFFLDRQKVGDVSGLGSQSGLEGTHGELWSTILRRRLNNQYTGKNTGPMRAEWMYRHFYVRMKACPAEGTKKSAAHVAAIWKGNEVSVRTNATKNKRRVKAWIDALEAHCGQSFTFADGSSRKFKPIEYKFLDSTIERFAAEFSD